MKEKDKRWFPRLAKEHEVTRCPKCGHVRAK